MFSKEKDFILKLTNIALILWLIGAISALQFSLTDLFIKEPKLSLEEYNNYHCGYYNKDIESASIYSSCSENYDSYLIERNRFDSNQVKFVVMSAGNVVIVSLALYFINKERK